MLTDMNKNNKAYIRPDMRVVKLQHSPLLQITSGKAEAPRRHVIEDDTAY